MTVMSAGIKPLEPRMSVERIDWDDPAWQGNSWFQVVLERTYFARAFCQDARVLDAPCGCGWSSSKFAERAKYVLGVDYADEAIAVARQRYRSPNLEFRQMNCLSLELDNASFDVAVSIEALEHFNHSDGLRYVAELARILRPGGFLVGTTPSAHGRKNAAIRLKQEKNEFHLKIFWPQELRRCLRRHFEEVSLVAMPNGGFFFWARKSIGWKNKVRSAVPEPFRPWLTQANQLVRRSFPR